MVATLKDRLVHYPVAFIVYTLVSALAALFPVWVSSITHILLPILVMVTFGMQTRFGYIKLNSLIGGRLLVILAALGWGVHRIELFYLLFLLLNILEATLFDFYKGHYWNSFNGLLVLFSSCYLVLGWTGSCLVIDNESYLSWIIAYTIWNANFVSLQLSGGYYVHHYLILLSPIIACLWMFDFSFWLIFRESSLLLGITILAMNNNSLAAMEQQLPFLNMFEKIQFYLRKQKTQRLLSLVVIISLLVQLVLSIKIF